MPGSLEDIKRKPPLARGWNGIEAGGRRRIGPYFQSERLDIYQRFAQQLIDEGKAYYCYCTPERLQQLRQAQGRRQGTGGI